MHALTLMYLKRCIGPYIVSSLPHQYLLEAKCSKLSIPQHTSVLVRGKNFKTVNSAPIQHCQNASGVVAMEPAPVLEGNFGDVGQTAGKI